MAIYGIGDLHLDFTGQKPMNIFGPNWEKHEEKIFESWRRVVRENDLVLIPGDVSWASKLYDAYEDLKKIDELPGIKVISKGNHDYWWETKTKMNALGLKTIHFLFNDSFIYDDVAICGTRGWPAKDSDEFDSHDEKIFDREINRLKLSLNSSDGVKKKVVMLHYPPFNVTDSKPNEFAKVMKEYGVYLCVYGHLHGEGHRLVVNGTIDGIDYVCISSDYLDFKLEKIL